MMAAMNRKLSIAVMLVVTSLRCYGVSEASSIYSRAVYVLA